MQLSGALSISQGGSVQGEVEAESVVVGGELLGNVSARSEVAVSAGARLIGDVSASDLDLEEGAVFSGRVEMDFELPAELRAAG